MPIYALGDYEPDIHPDAYVHDTAVIIGRVSIGAESTIWANTVLRGDDGNIKVGERTSIQDGSVIHVISTKDTTIGNDCTVGHLVHLEACDIKDGGLVGSGSVVLHRAVVGEHALVAANAVVLADTVIPPEALAVGIPAKIIEGASDVKMIKEGAKEYIKRGKTYRQQLRRLG